MMISGTIQTHTKTILNVGVDARDRLTLLTKTAKGWLRPQIAVDERDLTPAFADFRRGGSPTKNPQAIANYRTFRGALTPHRSLALVPGRNLRGAVTCDGEIA